MTSTSGYDLEEDWKKVRIGQKSIRYISKCLILSEHSAEPASTSWSRGAYILASTFLLEQCFF